MMKVVWFWDENRKVVIKREDDKFYRASGTWLETMNPVNWELIELGHDYLSVPSAGWQDAKYIFDDQWSVNDISAVQPDAFSLEMCVRVPGRWCHATLMPSGGPDFYGYYYNDLLNRMSVRGGSIWDEDDCDCIGTIENLRHGPIFGVDYLPSPL